MFHISFVSMTPNIYRALLKLKESLITAEIPLKTENYELDFEKTIEYSQILQEIDEELKISKGIE